MKRGFTLIELLVVVAIIAIIAAILFPVFAQVRDKARQAGCLSNCRQIGLGLMMYAQDYDEILPEAWGGWPQTIWAHNIQPYVKNLAVWTCPSRPNQRWEGGINNRPGTGGYGKEADRRLGYGLNTTWTDEKDGLGCPAHCGLGRAPTPMSQIAAPAEFIIAADSRAYEPKTYGDAYSDTVQVQYYAKGKQLWLPAEPEFRHNEGAVVIFGDGHAKWYKESYLIARVNHHHWLRCNENHFLQ